MSEDSPAGSLAVDAMGSDLGPAEVVAAISLALKEYEDIQKLLVVGQQDVIEPLLNAANIESDPRIEIVHASEVIGMDEKPIQSIKQKKDASLVRAIEMVKEKRARGVISCGNTGALMAAGTIRLRPAPGVERPAIGVIMPSRNHHFVMIDAGANPDARPIHLVHNAVLGSNYCKVALNVENPRVGLLSIGTEEGKGNEAVLEAHKMLSQLGDQLNYHGLVEGFQLFQNHVDVIVCDGFVGNILLKTSESLFYVLKDYLKDELKQNPIRLAGAILSKGAFDAMKQQLDPKEYGGAPLLGLKGLVMKAHGSSNRHFIKSAIGLAANAIQKDMRHAIEADIRAANDVLKSEENEAGA